MQVIMFLTLSITIALTNQNFPQELEILTPTNQIENSGFGGPVAIYDNFVFISAPWENVNFDGKEIYNAGAVYVFKNIQGNWTEHQRIALPNPKNEERFGVAVAIDGKRAIVGAPGFNNFSGGAFIYEYNGEKWIQTQQVIASDGKTGDKFGYSVSISGTIVIVGAFRKNSNKGGAYIFELEDNTWNETCIITPKSLQEYDNFGWAVAIEGYSAVVGAPNRNNNSGAIFNYKRTDEWHLIKEFTADDIQINNRFGYSVCLFDTRLAVASPGNRSTYMFHKYPSGAFYQEKKKVIENLGDYENFGHSVSYYGNDLLVGGTPDSYIFKKAGIYDLLPIKISSPKSKDSSGEFGWFVSLQGGYAVISAAYFNGSYGVAFLWQYDSTLTSTHKVNSGIRPSSFYLSNNYPNPFNPSTKISFGLPEQSTASLVIYDITGKVVKEFLRNKQLPAGSYSYSFNASNLSSGIYIYRLQTGKFTATKKLILMK